ncbi:galactosylceramide sulfotransferase-like [Diadema antillarum]|uniref:galactosylceramide sulfotransferase-like n=1 Tax=Diadema antillarum TaxID=105358 RepID=UPI003A846A18
MAFKPFFRIRRRVALFAVAMTSLVLSVLFYSSWSSSSYSPLSTSELGGSSRRRLTVITDVQGQNGNLRGKTSGVADRVIRNWTKYEGRDDLQRFQLGLPTVSGVAARDQAMTGPEQWPGANLENRPEKDFENDVENGQIRPDTFPVVNSVRKNTPVSISRVDVGAAANSNALPGQGQGRDQAAPPAKKPSSSGRESEKRGTVSNWGGCHPQHNIVFWKTHKCASSTVQNIMFRHAEKNDLRFLLPARTHLFDLIRRFNASRDVPAGFIERERPFNMFAHHARFHAADVATLMPANSLYVTILRDPLTLFESIYTYLELPVHFGNDTHPVSIRSFLKEPTKYYSTSDMNVHRRYARNPLLYDLGLEPTEMDSKSRIADTILEVQMRFHLVMIAEYFDESLILLKQLLCWDYDDILYLKLNAREKTRRVTPFVQNLLKKWNYGDSQLYQYFNDTFWTRVRRYGYERMQRDVRTLRLLNARLLNRCVREATNADDIDDQESIWHPEGVDIVAYRLRDIARNDRTCKNVIKPEKLFTEELRAKQGDYFFPPNDRSDETKWWHIKDRTERNVVKVLDALMERLHPKDKSTS